MIKKIHFFVFYLFIITTCSYSQPSWQRIKTPTDFNLLKVAYLDSLHCWVAGDSGVILFSNDQGASWQIQNSGVSNYINDIYFLNENLGWAVTFELDGANIRSKILKTSDGGNVWEKSNYRHLNIILTSIFFEDSLNGWIGGEPFDLSYSEDGGLNWAPADIDSGAFANFPIYKLRFINSHYGFAVGGRVDIAGVVWRYDNATNLWKAYGIAPDKFDDFVFVDSTTALTLTADIERLYPIGVLNFDVKKNFWDYYELNKYGKVTSIASRTGNEYWCTLGCDTSFLVSFDNLTNWQFVPTMDSICINALAFADSLHGIAVAEAGNVFKYIPANPVNVEILNMELPNLFMLQQNYPNPFNPITKISWQSPLDCWQTLKLYDILGNEIFTLVNEFRYAGAYEIEFNSSISNLQLVSGVYYYQLRAGNYIATKKMILIK